MYLLQKAQKTNHTFVTFAHQDFEEFVIVPANYSPQVSSISSENNDSDSEYENNNSDNDNSCNEWQSAPSSVCDDEHHKNNERNCNGSEDSKSVEGSDDNNDGGVIKHRHQTHTRHNNTHYRTTAETYVEYHTATHKNNVKSDNAHNDTNREHSDCDDNISFDSDLSDGV